MKAKEWAAKLAEASENRDETLKAFVEEIGAVAKQRGGSVNATEGAVREQRAKWQAICRELPSLDPNQFETLLDAHGAEYKKAEAAVKAQAARKGPAEQGADRPLPGRRLGARARGGGPASP
jgi:hypothetical protein